MSAKTTSTKPKRSPEEQRILEEVAEVRGWEWAEAHAELILEQARHLGELPEQE